MRRLAAALAALALVPCAHAAGTDEDFAASKGASAEAQLRERLLSRVRTLPGTQTQYLIGGYLQLDGLATRHLQEGGEQSTFFASAAPFGPADSDLRASVRQSQLDWISRTPTRAGPLWTRFEANLLPYDGTTSPELNLLFVKLGEAVTLGKAYTTFMDESALPTTLDYNGPGGATFVRQWLARAGVPLGERWVAEASIEEAQADLSAGDAALGVETRARRPDLAARVRYEREAGHLQVAALSRRVDVTVQGAGGTLEREVSGSGLSVSGSLALLAADQLMFQVASGKGVGRYFSDPLSTVGLALSPGNTLDLVRMTGATLYYQRQWAPGWQTVAGASTLRADTDGQRTADSLDRIVYASINLIHRFTPTLFAGAEALWGEARRVDAERATNARLQISVRYLIF